MKDTIVKESLSLVVSTAFEFKVDVGKLVYTQIDVDKKQILRGEKIQ